MLLLLIEKLKKVCIEKVKGDMKFNKLGRWYEEIIGNPKIQFINIIIVNIFVFSLSFL